MKRIAGCGIDIEEISRFRGKIPAINGIPGFSEMIYSPEELTGNMKSNPGLKFPLCFSCKEAFFKAFGVSWTNSSISWKDIELLFNDENDLSDHSVRLSGHAKKLYDTMDCNGFESYFEFNDDFVLFQVILYS